MMYAVIWAHIERFVSGIYYYSEVLLSSEARTITYVSKQGQRSEHSLDDVLQTGATAV
jgi:hypothetical protein